MLLESFVRERKKKKGKRKKKKEKRKKEKGKRKKKKEKRKKKKGKRKKKKEKRKKKKEKRKKEKGKKKKEKRKKIKDKRKKKKEKRKKKIRRQNWCFHCKDFSPHGYSNVRLFVFLHRYNTRNRIGNWSRERIIPVLNRAGTPRYCLQHLKGVYEGVSGRLTCVFK